MKNKKTGQEVTQREHLMKEVGVKEENRRRGEEEEKKRKRGEDG